MTDVDHVQWNKWAAIATVCSAFVALLTALINLVTLYSIWGQYDVMQRDSNVRIRPWIKTVSAGFMSPLKKGQYAVIAINHRNFGDVAATREAPDNFKVHVVGSSVSPDDAAKDYEHFAKDCMATNHSIDANYMEFPTEKETSYKT